MCVTIQKGGIKEESLGETPIKKKYLFGPLRSTPHRNTGFADFLKIGVFADFFWMHIRIGTVFFLLPPSLSCPSLTRKNDFAKYEIMFMKFHIYLRLFAS